MSRWKCDDSRFRVSGINKKFKLCHSYPEQVTVPASVSDEEIIKVGVAYDHNVWNEEVGGGII